MKFNVCNKMRKSSKRECIWYRHGAAARPSCHAAERCLGVIRRRISARSPSGACRCAHAFPLVAFVHYSRQHARTAKETDLALHASQIYSCSYLIPDQHWVKAMSGVGFNPVLILSWNENLPLTAEPDLAACSEPGGRDAAAPGAATAAAADAIFDGCDRQLCTNAIRARRRGRRLWGI